MTEERVALFIDGSNFYHLLKENNLPTHINFAKLAFSLLRNRRLMRMYYYNVCAREVDGVERYENQQKFFQSLKKTPYLELKLGRLERRGNTVIEKGVDVMMATDILYFATINQYDTAVLVSGDGDLCYCIEKVKDLGKHVEVACPRLGFASELKEKADVFTVLDENIIRECLVRLSAEYETKKANIDNLETGDILNEQFDSEYFTSHKK
ncbi:MAG: NYN domain-containing protein [Planctomycetota bacterium]